MQAYLLALELEPVEIGKTYEVLPLHTTLVHWFWLEAPKIDELIKLVSKLTTEKLSLEALEEAIFTEFTDSGTIPVTVSRIEKSDTLSDLHNRITALIDSLGGTYEKPEYIGGGYEPHVTHQYKTKINTGDILQADNLFIAQASKPQYGNTRKIIYTLSLN